jgi:hypothetical protein
VTGSLDIDGRAGRDLVLDLLRVAETYPLRDLPVGFLRSAAGGALVLPSGSVPLGASAQIVVQHRQVDVDYALCDLDGVPLPDAPAGSTAVLDGISCALLPSPAVTSDRTVRVRGTKRRTGRAVLLTAVTTVHVGFDLGLPVRVRPAADVTIRSADRVVVCPPETVLTVDVDDTQPGVQYSLVALHGTGTSTALSAGSVAGQRGTISLATAPVTGDTVLAVQVRRTVDGTTSTELLATTVRLLLQPRADVAVTLDPVDGIVDLGGTAALTVAGEDGVRYQVHVRTVGEREWLRDDRGAVSLPPPGHPLTWSDPSEYLAVGEPVDGPRAELTIPDVRRNLQVVVSASRSVTLAPVETETVELPIPALLLVRPDPHPDLLLRVRLVAGPSGELPGASAAADAVTDGHLEVVGGQPGVRYQPESPPGTGVSTWPAYVHRRDATAPDENRGIDQLTVGVDLVLARDQAGSAAGPARTPPLTPLLDTPPLPLGTELTVQASWAETTAGVTLPVTVVIGPVPRIDVEPGKPGQPGQLALTVRSAPEGSRFSLLIDGAAAGIAQNGSGADLTLGASSVAPDAVVEVAVRSGTNGALALERVVAVPRPAP